jgi:hypothetical protein
MEPGSLDDDSGSQMAETPDLPAEAIPLRYDDPEPVEFEIVDGLLLVNLDYDPDDRPLDWDFDQALIVATSPGGLTIRTQAQYHVIDVTVTAHRQPPPPLSSDWLVDERHLNSPHGFLFMSTLYGYEYTAWVLPARGRWHVRVAARGLNPNKTMEQTRDGDRAEFLVDLWM